MCISMYEHMMHGETGDPRDMPFEEGIVFCQATDGGYICTEPRKHVGDHIAHGLNRRVLHRWPR